VYLISENASSSLIGLTAADIGLNTLIHVNKVMTWKLVRWDIRKAVIAQTGSCKLRISWFDYLSLTWMGAAQSWLLAFCIGGLYIPFYLLELMNQPTVAPDSLRLPW